LQVNVKDMARNAVRRSSQRFLLSFWERCDEDRGNDYDNRNKTILYKVVRVTVQIGCRIDCRLMTLADINLFEYATNEIR
jgi:hypothetical protein